MTALEVVQCGPGACVQDSGRHGFQRFGVSTAGAMDREALAVANALVGNPPEAAGLELPLCGATFRVSGSAVLVAASGPGTRLSVSGQLGPADSSMLAKDGDVLMVGPPKGGVYSYLAVAGGVLSHPVLGSRSCHRRSGLGRAPLSAGARLACQPATSRVPMGLNRPRDDLDRGPIRIVAGPQAELFDAEAWANLTGQSFRISANSDRMGIRLEGHKLTAPGGHDIVSEGVVAGCIQVPGDSQPIVLGRDCQTTGGYPKIATVISADLGRLAQIPFAEAIRFREVTVQEAITAARALATRISQLSTDVQPVAALETKLLTENLISGITAGVSTRD